MTVSELTQLIWAIFWLIVVIAAIIVIFSPPRWLTDLKTSFGAIRRLKLGNLEAEMDRSSDRTDLEAEEEHDEPVSAPPTRGNVEKHERTSPSTVANEVGENQKAESSFTSVILHFQEGKYQAGMELARELVAKDSTPEDKVTQTAMAYSLAFELGNYCALEDLESYLQEHGSNPYVYKWLATSYKKIQDSERAAATLRAGLDVAGTDTSKISLASDLASILWEDSRKAEAVDTLTHILPGIQAPEARSEGLRALASLRLKGGAVFPAFEMWEAGVALVPEDKDLRFQLAYEYTQHDAPGMALHHYMILLSRESDNGMAWNNCGVVAQRLGLHSKGVEHYLQAQKLGNTLANANLAYKFIGAGFLSEAEKALGECSEAEDVHANVLRARGRLAEVRAEEEEKQQSILQRAQRLSEWRQKFASATLRASKEGVSGSWQGEGLHELALREPLEGEVEGDFTWGPSDGRHQLRGTRVGRAIRFTWREIPADGRERALGLLPPPASGWGLLLMRGEELVGFSIQEDMKLDPGQAKNYREWHLVRAGQNGAA